jgi:hypothetical protein
MSSVAQMSFMEVLKSEYCWPLESLYNDEYDDDISKDCISSISQLLFEKKNILIIGCNGGGYNTFQLCYKIIEESIYAPQITVIDKCKHKVSIGIIELHC